ncbi:hypothetical protein ZWY2020_009700 [Hordeum vulgare]|nr:hypothetical protein ZWY2020_009700 [Hordeum vulgare]
MPVQLALWIIDMTPCELFVYHKGACIWGLQDDTEAAAAFGGRGGIEPPDSGSCGGIGGWTRWGGGWTRRWAADDDGGDTARRRRLDEVREHSRDEPRHRRTSPFGLLTHLDAAPTTVLGFGSGGDLGMDFARRGGRRSARRTRDGIEKPA